MKTNSYKDLIVWQKAMDLVVMIYEITREFPSNEQYGLSSQLRRAAVSIPSNIAEGYRRGSEAEYVRFLRISYGSASEAETQLLLTERLRYGPSEKIVIAQSLLEEVLRMLNKMTLDESSKGGRG